MSKKTTKKVIARLRRKVSIRKKIAGTAVRPRLSVFRSANHMYAQLVDDDQGQTLAAASTQTVTVEGNKGNKEAAKAVGAAIAAQAKAAGITTVIFDRNGFKYHGRVKALADAAREGGLSF
jgi:large subunit ribosomal protein L18